jgi:hypothetical protein
MTIRRATVLCATLVALGQGACAGQPAEQGGAGAPSATAQPPTASEPGTSSDDMLGLLADGRTLSSDAAGVRARAVPAPIAESAAFERGPTEGLGVTPGAAQSSYDATPLLPLLPRPDAEVPRAWIGWHINQSIDAFRKAIDLDRPLVLVLSVNWCRYCGDLIRDALRCPAVERLAGDAVFAYSFVHADRGSSAIAGSLEISAYPTITVLEPEARLLLERGRINGYFNANLLGRHLETILWNTPPRIFVSNGTDDPRTFIERAGPIARTETSRPGLDFSAILEAGRRGLTHGTPKPACR